MAKVKIGVDIDQVIFNVIEPFLSFYNERFGTQLTIDDVYDYNLAKVLDFSSDELQELFDIFNEGNLLTLPPVDGALEGVKNLAKEHEIIAVTSRPLKTMAKTVESLSLTFPNCFSGIHFTGQSFDLINRHGRTKGSLCRELGLNHMIEDSLEHAKEIRETSPETHVWLFGNYKWNRIEDKLDGITSAGTWKEVVEGIGKEVSL